MSCVLPGQSWAVCAPAPAFLEGRWSSRLLGLSWCSAELRPFALLSCLLFVSNSVHDTNSSFNSVYLLFVSCLSIYIRSSSGLFCIMTGCLCECLRAIFSWEVEEILSPNVKFHENRNHDVWNPVLNWGSCPSFSERGFALSHLTAYY